MPMTDDMYIMDTDEAIIDLLENAAHNALNLSLTSFYAITLLAYTATSINTVKNTMIANKVQPIHAVGEPINRNTFNVGIDYRILGFRFCIAAPVDSSKYGHTTWRTFVYGKHVNTEGKEEDLELTTWAGYNPEAEPPEDSLVGNFIIRFCNKKLEISESLPLISELFMYINPTTKTAAEANKLLSIRNFMGLIEEKGIETGSKTAVDIIKTIHPYIEEKT
jgi:hypothetical protein